MLSPLSHYHIPCPPQVCDLVKGQKVEGQRERSTERNRHTDPQCDLYRATGTQDVSSTSHFSPGQVTRPQEGVKSLALHRTWPQEGVWIGCFLVMEMKIGFPIPYILSPFIFVIRHLMLLGRLGRKKLGLLGLCEY